MDINVRDIFIQKLNEIQSRIPLKMNGVTANTSFQEILDTAAEKQSLAGNAIPSAGNTLSSTGFTQTSAYNNNLSDFEKAKLSLQNTNAVIPSNDNDKMKQINYNIQLAAQKYGIDPDLIRAVIKQESDYDQFSLSHAGAQGLMQLMPETVETLKLTDPWDIAQNIDGGTRHLKDAFNAFDGDLKLALAAYNAGQGAVRKYNGIPPYKETQNYVQKVTDYYAQYSGTK